MLSVMCNGLICSPFLFQVPHISHQSPSLDIVKLSVFQGNGLNASNLMITNRSPSAFTWLLPSTDVPSVDLGAPEMVYANITQMGCYNLRELTAVLASLEADPLNEAFAIVLFDDISMHGALEAGWPKEGYLIKNPVNAFECRINTYGFVALTASSTCNEGVHQWAVRQ